jgi:hypothetical protein
VDEGNAAPLGEAHRLIRGRGPALLLPPTLGKRRRRGFARMGAAGTLKGQLKLQRQKESPAEAGQGLILGSSDEASPTNPQIAAVLRPLNHRLLCPFLI